MDSGLTKKRDESSCTSANKSNLNVDVIKDSLDTELLVHENAHHRELQKLMSDEAEKRETKRNKHKLPRQSPRGDEYAYLRYDPDWRRNLPGAQLLCKVHTSLSLDSDSSVSEDMSGRGRRDYVVVSNPVEVDVVQSRPPSFHLHPQQGLFSHEDTTVSQTVRSSLESTSSFNSDGLMMVRSSIHQNAAEVLPSSPAQKRHPKESNKQYDGEDQSIGTGKLNSIAPRSRKSKPSRPIVDIVERNKTTLGVKSPKQGSYLKAYGQQGWRPDYANQHPEPIVDSGSTDIQGGPDNSLNPELTWIQQTQKLKIHKESTRSDRPRPQIHRSRVHMLHPVRHTSEPGQRAPTPATNWMLAPPDPAGIFRPSRHQPLPGAPTVLLNAGAKRAEPSLSGQLHEQVVSPAPTPPLSQRRIGPDGWSLPSISPAGDPVAILGAASQVSMSRPAPGNHQMCRNHLQDTGRRPVGEPGLTEGTAVINDKSIGTCPKWPAFEETSNVSDPAVILFDEESVHSDYTLPTYKGAYAVLPPIGGPIVCNSGLCTALIAPTLNSIPRSNSEGYLAQLEKQRQLKPQTTYKVYTLQDYRSLNQEVRLGGLGPSHTVTEKVAEKIKRQKLYSNVIREQNKKISTIPFLPDRNPLGSENISAIPRKKALEYAKSIVKPKAPQQWRGRPKEQGEKEKVLEHPVILQLGLDLSQLAVLDMLRRRHEEEKQAVARITSLHSNSSVPSVNTH